MWFHLYVESNEQNKWKNKIETVIDTENKLTIVKGERGWGAGEGIKKYRLTVTKQSRDVKYSIGNRVKSIVTTMYGARWLLEISGDHSVKYMIV